MENRQNPLKHHPNGKNPQFDEHKGENQKIKKIRRKNNE